MQPRSSPPAPPGPRSDAGDQHTPPGRIPHDQTATRRHLMHAASAPRPRSGTQRPRWKPSGPPRQSCRAKRKEVPGPSPAPVNARMKPKTSKLRMPESETRASAIPKYYTTTRKSLQCPAPTRSERRRPRWELLHPARSRSRTPSHCPGGTLRAHARARAPKSLILSCANFRELHPSHTERNDIP